MRGWGLFVISVNRVGINVYEVVLEEGAETHHRVAMSAG